MTTVDLSADHRPTIGRSSADCQNPKTVDRWKNNYSMKNCRAYWFRLVRHCVGRATVLSKIESWRFFFFDNFVVNSIQTRLPHPACFYFRITSIFGVHIYPTPPPPSAHPRPLPRFSPIFSQVYNYCISLFISGRPRPCLF